MTHGVAGAYQLAQRHDGQRLGGLLHQGPGERHGRHRAHERKGGDDHALAVARHDHDVVEDLFVDAARGIHVGHRHQRRPRGQLLDAAAVLDRGHGDRILRLHAADAACRPHGIRELDVRLVGEQMARRDRHVHRLDHDAALPVQHAEHVGQLEDVAECLDVAIAASAFEVADVGGAGHGAEVDHVVADVQVPLRVARVQHEARRRVRELRLDELAPEPHHLRGIVHQRAGAAVHLAGGGAADLQARLLEHLEGGLQDPLDLLAR